LGKRVQKEKRVVTHTKKKKKPHPFYPDTASTANSNTSVAEK
jgi:hypothetical protein